MTLCDFHKTTSGYLAQLNVAKLLVPLDHPMIKDFNDGIAYINNLAESSPGFIWRLKDENLSDAGVTYNILGDGMMIFTISVWEGIEALKEFTYNSDHVSYYRRKKEWFHKMSDFNYVLWCIPKNHCPSVSESVSRLKFLNLKGESPKAFTFKTASQWSENINQE